jgi:hypothetical protein
MVGDAAEGQEGIDANHTQMCKFGTRDDPGYKKVHRAIRNFVVDASSASRGKNDGATLRLGKPNMAQPMALPIKVSS